MKLIIKQQSLWTVILRNCEFDVVNNFQFTLTIKSSLKMEVPVVGRHIFKFVSPMLGGWTPQTTYELTRV